MIEKIFLSLSLVTLPELHLTSYQNAEGMCIPGFYCGNIYDKEDIVRIDTRDLYPDEAFDKACGVDIKRFTYTEPPRTVWVDERGECGLRFYDYGSDSVIDTYRKDCPGAFGKEAAINNASSDVKDASSMITRSYETQKRNMPICLFNIKRIIN